MTTRLLSLYTEEGKSYTFLDTMQSSYTDGTVVVRKNWEGLVTMGKERGIKGWKRMESLRMCKHIEEEWI